MGMDNIDFMWYFKNISLYALWVISQVQLFCTSEWYDLHLANFISEM